MRNSTMKGQALGFANSMADALAAAGVASYRFDKRGVGSSAGDYLSTGFHTETADAAAALAALAGAPEVTKNQIGLVGHSVGALIAVRLAADNSDVSSVVMLAGPARSGREVLAWQGDRIAASLPGPRWLLPRIFRSVQTHNLAKVERSTTDTVRVLLKPRAISRMFFDRRTEGPGCFRTAPSSNDPSTRACFARFPPGWRTNKTQGDRALPSGDFGRQVLTSPSHHPHKAIGHWSHW